MGKKIHSIELKEAEVFEVEPGKYEKRFVNPKKHPVLLTNKALIDGKKSGVPNFYSALFKLKNLVGKDGEIDLETLSPEEAELIDTDNFLPLIYLGLIGANKSLDLSYEGFLDKYHADTTEVIQDYSAIVSDYAKLTGATKN